MSEKQLIDMQKSLEFSFGEIIRAAVAEQLKAKFAGDTARFDELVALEDEARSKLRQARMQAMVADLSTAKIDALVAGLGDKVSRARDLLEDLRRTREVLENLRKAAELATAILGTVATILA